MAVLAVAQKTACTADLQVAHRNAEARPERRELPDGRKPLGRDLGQHLIACEGEIRIRLAGAASHAPADLVQQAQSHAVRIFNNQRVAVAHVHAGLN